MEKFAPAFVLDCSVAMAWCFEDEQNDYCEAVLESLTSLGASVPTIWWLEIVNVLLVAERKKRLSKLDASHFLTQLNELSLHTDHNTPNRACGTIMTLATEQNLTSYDAAYLELAMNENLPIATLDKQIKTAAKKIGVPLYTI